MGDFKKCSLVFTLSVIFLSFCTKPCSSGSINHGETDCTDTEAIKHEQRKHIHLSKQLREEREENSRLTEEIDKLQAEKKILEALVQRISIVQHYRTQADILQWSLASDPQVQQRWSDVDQSAIKVPTGISSQKEIKSYRTQYGIWFSIVRAMQNTTEPRLMAVKQVFEEVGISVEDAELVGSAAAKLFYEITAEAEKNDKKVQYKDENEIVKILEDWRINDPYQLGLVRVIYRLDLS